MPIEARFFCIQKPQGRGDEVAKKGKKSIIEKNLKKIEKWSSEGLTMQQIADNLEISVTTLYRHRAKSDKIKGTVGRGRRVAVKTLENSMFKAANGYTQKVKKYEKLKRCEYENGKKVREWEEMTEYEIEEIVKPDITAGIFLLKNWGNYMNEPRAMEIRKKELQLREKQVENQTW